MANHVAIQPVTVVKEGWLDKKSRYIGSWRRRWIVLTSNALYTFKNEKVYKDPTEVFEISSINFATTFTKSEQINMFFIQQNQTVIHFKASTVSAKENWIKTINAYINFIELHVTVQCERNMDYCCNFELKIPYYSEYNYPIDRIITDIINHVQKVNKPVQFEPTKINSNSFLRQDIIYNDYDWENSSIKITDFSKELVKQSGIHLNIDIKIYQHNVSSQNVMSLMCTNMNNNIDLCPIYAQMRYQDIFSEKYLNHLYEYNHFQNEFVDKPECKYHDDCYAYVRLTERGGNELKDRCHIALYRHPPRGRKAKSSEDINSFCLNDEWAENIELYHSTDDDNKNMILMKAMDF
eukprot:435672_1